MGTKLVKATREGLTGKHTATGWVINDNVPFCALPSEAALRQWVIVSNPVNHKMVKLLVLDVGPHYINDDEYVFGDARPRAESDGSNRAGIDLGEYAWRELGMEDNTMVEWKFAEDY